jgi:hypothetical protein
MRITMFVGRADLSGGQRVIHIYAQKLQERGHEVLVIARPAPAARRSASSCGGSC